MLNSRSCTQIVDLSNLFTSAACYPEGASRRDAIWARQGLIDGLISIIRPQVYLTSLRPTEITFRHQISKLPPNNFGLFQVTDNFTPISWARRPQ